MTQLIIIVRQKTEALKDFYSEGLGFYFIYLNPFNRRSRTDEL